MDCEKFESTLLDELYDELDELTSAASKRHVAGCARCAGLFSGLQATRRVAVLDMVAPPAGLEERVLLAAREAQKVIPLRSRLSRVVSLAGSWAMRPQTAMAAVFLLMIGSSVILVRSRQAPHASSSSLVVTEQGAPAALATAEEPDFAMDPSTAAQAHGALEAPKRAAGPAPSAVGGSLLATREESKRAEANADGRGNTEGDAPLEERMYAKSDRASAAAPAAVAKGGLGESEMPAAAPPLSQSVTRPSESRPGADFASGRAQFNAKNYDEAVRIFDGLAASGDNTAALWAARAVRNSSGCAAAAPRFDQVSSRAYGTAVGYDATLEGGQCYRILGSFDMARSHFARLLTVPTHEARARAELDTMSPRAGGAGGAAVRSAPKAAAPPANPPPARAND